MPYDDLVRLLICKVPDGKEFTSRKELLPYLNYRWVELIKKSEMSFEKLENMVESWLDLYNPFLAAGRPQDLADLILESPHYREVLDEPENNQQEEYYTFDEEALIGIYEEETFEGLLQLLHEFF